VRLNGTQAPIFQETGEIIVINTNEALEYSCTKNCDHQWVNCVLCSL